MDQLGFCLVGLPMCMQLCTWTSYQYKIKYLSYVLWTTHKHYTDYILVCCRGLSSMCAAPLIRILSFWLFYFMAISEAFFYFVWMVCYLCCFMAISRALFCILCMVCYLWLTYGMLQTKNGVLALGSTFYIISICFTLWWGGGFITLARARWADLIWHKWNSPWHTSQLTK